MRIPIVNEQDKVILLGGKPLEDSGKQKLGVDSTHEDSYFRE
jgi:hypothetical protein